MNEDHKDKIDGCLQHMGSGSLETLRHTTVLNTCTHRKDHGTSSLSPDINSQINMADDRDVSQINDSTNPFLNLAATMEYLPLNSKDQDKVDEHSLGSVVIDNDGESGAKGNELASDTKYANRRSSTSDGRLTDNNLADDSTNSHPVEVTVRPKEMSAEQLIQTYLRKAVEYMCNNCFEFIDCVVASGNLAFVIDNKQVANVQVKETVRACRNNVNDKNTNIVASEELLTKIDDELAVLSKSTVKIRQQRVPIKKENVSDGESDLKDGAESAGERYNDPNDDDYVPDSGVKKVPKLKMKTRGRKARTPKSLHANKQKVFQCEHCSYTARFFGHFKNHCESKHQYPAEDLIDMEKKIMGTPSSRPDVKTEDADEDADMDADSDDKVNPTGTAKRDRKRIHKCDREGCTYSTDHIGHFRDHLNRHDGLRPFKCEQCPKDFVRQDDLKRHEERHLRTFECPVCAQTFDSRVKLKEHAKSQHDYEGRIAMFSCGICKSSFSTHEELEKHTLERHNHVCSICGEAFNVKRDLAKHRMVQHKDEVLKCQICGKSLPTTTALRKHVARHDTEGSQFPCDVCGKTFTAASTLYHHKRGVHTDEKPYTCKLCGQGFNFHHSMKLHILRHKGLRPHKCSLCDKSYLTATHLRGHMDAVHSAKKRFVCPVCDKKFPYENSLKMHMMLHTNDRPFVCHLCGRGFVSNNALKNHEGTHVEGKNFECTVCHKKYKTEQLLRAHTRRHTNDGSRFMCDLCGNTFMYRSNLDAHMAVHGEQRNYICPDCGKCFKTAATLYSHKLVHREETPFTCNICSKGFKSKERLAQHQHRHSGLKPFVCDRCGHAFPDKGGLSKHRKTVHAVVKKFSCPVCGKTCARADN